MNHKAFYNGIVETYKKAGLQEENLLKDVLCMWNSLNPLQKQAVSEEAVANWEVEADSRDELYKLATGEADPGVWGRIKNIGQEGWNFAKNPDAYKQNFGKQVGQGAMQGGMGEFGSKLKQWAPYLIGPAIGAIGGGMMGGWRGAAGGALAGAAGAYGYNQMQNPESWMSKQYRSLFPGQNKTTVNSPEGNQVNVSTPKPGNIPASGTIENTNVLATDPSKNQMQENSISH